VTVVLLSPSAQGIEMILISSNAVATITSTPTEASAVEPLYEMLATIVTLLILHAVVLACRTFPEANFAATVVYKLQAEITPNVVDPVCLTQLIRSVVMVELIIAEITLFVVEATTITPMNLLAALTAA